MEQFFIASLAFFLVGALTSLIFQRNKGFAHLSSSIFAILGSLSALYFAATTLLTGSSYGFTIPTSFPLFTITLHIDSLAAFFIFVISLIALPASVYGISYLKPYFKDYNTGLFGFFYNLFIMSLLLVVTSYNGLYFLFVWEIMSITSFFLVLFENKHKATIQAGLVYFIMTHVASAFISGAFLLLYFATGSFDFGVIKSHGDVISGVVKNTALICFLIGFGTKAGIIPFHIWLPKAHSAAPSHVSSLMSGVMIKMGIFMFVRMFLDILTPSPWLGYVVLFIGAISSILGVLYALSEHDSKRLLAFHSIENIGIILLGLGSGLVFLSLNLPVLASLAVIAGLYHTINHAIFKSLLFLSAGAVISKTHTRNIEEYGGLIKKMPYTALFFLIAAIAIVGLPPFNGFISEWLTFQGLFSGIALHGVLLKSVFIFAGVCLALTGGLAAACFVKAFGITFLARPRSEESEHAKEVSFTMVLSMGFLATLCLVFSIFAPYIISKFQMIVSTLGAFSTQVSVATGVTDKLSSTILPNSNAALLLGSFILSLIIVHVATYIVSRKQKATRGQIWECGYTEVTPRMEITATGFSRTLILIFKGIFRPSKQVDVEYVDADMRYAPKSKTITLGITDIYEEHLYNPMSKFFTFVSKQVKRTQSGNLNMYLVYIFAALIALLLVSRYFL